MRRWILRCCLKVGITCCKAETGFSVELVGIDGLYTIVGNHATAEKNGLLQHQMGVGGCMK